MKRFAWISLLLFSVTFNARKGVGQWVQTNGPEGGTVFCIAMLGENIFAGTASGIIESTDQGSTWEHKNEGLPKNIFITSIVAHDSSLFVGTFQQGVYRSTDSGASWISVSNGLPNSYTGITLGSSDHLLFAAVNYGDTYTSSNDGTQWIRVDTNLTKICRPQTFFTVGTTSYAGGSWIIQTTDDGSRWDVIAIPPADTTWAITSIANIGDILFASDQTLGVLRSTNHGSTWIRAATGLPKYSYFRLVTSGSILYLGAYDGFLFRSIDSARSWQPLASVLPMGSRLRSLASNGTELLTGFAGPGFFRSFDSGITWSECNQGLGYSEVNAIASMGDTTIVGSVGGLFLSDDHGQSWKPSTKGLTDNSISTLLVDGENLYAGSQSGTIHSGVFLSTNRGTTWSFPDSGLKTFKLHGLIRSGANLIAGGDPGNGKYGFYVSTNSGLNWSASTVDSRWNGCDVSGLLKVGTTLVASTDASPYVSHDNGLTWNVSETGLNFSDQIVVWSVGSIGSKIFIHCAPNGRGSYGIYISDDDGDSWHRAVDTSFPKRGKVTCFTTVSNTLFAATDSDGISFTTDDGAHWTSVNSGLGDSSVLSLAVQGNELLAGTATSGVWRRPLAEMLSQSAVSPTATVSQSVSAFPNPVSQSTTIHFITSESGPAQVAIVNLLGTEVARLFDGELEAGEHSFMWDAGGHGPDAPCQAGLYWCEVRMGGRAPARVGMMIVR